MKSRKSCHRNCDGGSLPAASARRRSPRSAMPRTASTAGNRTLLAGWYSSVLQVERADFLVLALAYALVEALAALFAQPAALHHLPHNLRDGVEFARRIIGRRLVEIAQHVHPYVEAYDIDQSEAGAFGQADQRAGERVHFFHRETELPGELRHLGAPEAADAVADEIRRVLAHAPRPCPGAGRRIPTPRRARAHACRRRE